MAAEQPQIRIFLGDGPRQGEYAIVDAGPDGGPPLTVTLPNPGSTEETTTYHLIQVRDSEWPGNWPMYQSTAPQGQSLLEKDTP